MQESRSSGCSSSSCGRRGGSYELFRARERVAVCAAHPARHLLFPQVAAAEADRLIPCAVAAGAERSARELPVSAVQAEPPAPAANPAPCAARLRRDAAVPAAGITKD